MLFGHGIWLAMLAWKLLGCAADTSAQMSAFRRFQTALLPDNASVWQLNGSEVQLQWLRRK